MTRQQAREKIHEFADGLLENEGNPLAVFVIVADAGGISVGGKGLRNDVADERATDYIGQAMLTFLREQNTG